MTDPSHDPAPTAVTGLLNLLAGLPAEMAGHVLSVTTSAGCQDLGDIAGHDRYLYVAVTTRRAGQVLADSLGVTCPPTTTGTLTSWTDPPPLVEVLQDDTWADPARDDLALLARDPQALIGHLTRLDQALRADPTAAGHLADGTTTVTVDPFRLHMRTRTIPASRALLACLCPDATMRPLTPTAPRTHQWQAHTPDTTITGPETHTHDDSDEDLP